jgi:hypothetical protein
MKYVVRATALVVAVAAATGCASQTPSAISNAAAVTGSAPAASPIDASSALVQMKRDLPVDGTFKKDITQRVDLDALTVQLKTRFSNAKAALEDFTWNHSDLGDTDSEVVYVLDAPNSQTFIGFAVFSVGGDDADHYASTAIAYYSTAGALLHVESRATGISDSEDAGDWTNANTTNVAAEEAALRRAFAFHASSHRVELLAGHSAPATIESLPFAALVNTVKSEIEKSTFAFADQGDNATNFVSVRGTDGAIAGYVLASSASDDADRWFAAGYALFSANGLLLDRKISSGGLADTMDDDSIKLSTNAQ